ncbi:MAG: hypothetical protein OJF60_001020 [Burkholderiaceae bacterium]|jgi:hypothetical protein|nr:MAG: hypothetical protein OJF60_001020 [Burkholderiaceae bacterium]
MQEKKYTVEWKALGWTILAWIASLFLLYGGTRALIGGLWKGAPLVILAGVVCLPPLWAYLTRASERTVPGWLIGCISLALAMSGAIVSADQQVKQQAQRERQAQLDMQKRVVEKRDAQAAEFKANKLIVLSEAQKRFDAGDAPGAWQLLTKFPTVGDPDLVRLRTAVRLALLREEIKQAPPGERSGQIYSEIANLDPTDSNAVSKAAEYQNLVAQRRTLEAQRADAAKGRPEENPQVQAEAQLAIQMAQYRCDSISSMRQLLTKTGFGITCNGYRYSYTITDEGGRMVVRLD